MATSTTRLGLTKPAGSDVVDVAVLNANADKIDAAVGIVVCTSTTRPTSPFTGQQIYETDTKQLQTYTGSAWQPTVNTTAFATIAQAAVAPVASTVVANAAARDAQFPSPVQGNRAFLSDLGLEQTYYGLYNASTNPGGRPAAGWYASQRNVGLVPVTATSVSNTGGSYVKNGGIVTFSGVSSISLNGVFSSAYKNYRLVVSDLLTASGTSQINVRMRNAGTDNAANSYYQLWTMKRINGTFQDNTGGPGTAYTLIGYDNNTAYSWHWSGDVIAPFEAKNTSLSGQGVGVDVTGLYMLNSTVLHTTNSSFDGITFYPSSSTMSGSIQIFGYNY